MDSFDDQDQSYLDAECPGCGDDGFSPCQQHSTRSGFGTFWAQELARAQTQHWEFEVVDDDEGCTCCVGMTSYLDWSAV